MGLSVWRETSKKLTVYRVCYTPIETLFSVFLGEREVRLFPAFTHADCYRCHETSGRLLFFFLNFLFLEKQIMVIFTYNCRLLIGDID